MAADYPGSLQRPQADVVFPGYSTGTPVGTTTSSAAQVAEVSEGLAQTSVINWANPFSWLDQLVGFAREGAGVVRDIAPSVGEVIALREGFRNPALSQRELLQEKRASERRALKLAKLRDPQRFTGVLVTGGLIAGGLMVLRALFK